MAERRKGKGPGKSKVPVREEELAQHIPSIRRYLSRILRPDEIEDGSQTVLERALENLDRFRGESSLRGWLLGIARNVGLELARARKRRPRLVDEDQVSTGDLVPDHPNQEEELGRKQQQAMALSALDGLNLDDKLVLLVTYVDGVSGPDAAEILGVSFAAFRQRLSRARQALARRLDDMIQNGEPASAEVMAQWESLLRPPRSDSSSGPRD